MLWPISAEHLVIASIVFGAVAVISGLILALLPGSRSGRCYRPTVSGSVGGTFLSLSSPSAEAAVVLGCATNNSISSKTDASISRKTEMRSRRVEEEEDDDPSEQFSDTRVLVIADDDDQDYGVDESHPASDSDVDSV